MPLDRFKTLPSWTPVAAGATTTLRLPIGPTYHKLFLPYSSLGLDEMLNIRVRLNGIDFQSFRSGTELDLFNQSKGKAAAAGLLVLDFEREGMRSKLVRESTAVGTLPRSDGLAVTSFDVSIDIDAGAVTPVLGQPRALTSPPRPLGLLKIWRDFTLNAGIVGENEFTDLPHNRAIERMAFDDSNVGGISRLKIRVDSYDHLDARNTDLVRLQEENINGQNFFSQAGWEIIDFGWRGDGTNLLEAAGSQDFRVLLTTGAAGAVPTSIMYLGNIEA